MNALKDRKISDDMLDNVSGGVRLGSARNDDTDRITCNHCHEVFRRTSLTGDLVCPFCHEKVDERKTTGSIGNRVTV